VSLRNLAYCRDYSRWFWLVSSIRGGPKARDQPAGFSRARKRSASGQDADEPVLRIHSMEINDLLPNAALPNNVQSLLDSEILAQRRYVFARNGQHGLSQVVRFRCHPTTSIA
jgi:hypothetical protein